MNARPRDTAIHLRLERVAAIGITPALQDLAWISPNERARVGGITLSKRRTQFLAGHWLARQCLATWAGGSPADYSLSAPEDGAPIVLATPCVVRLDALHFSLSHSGDWVACAVAAQPLGVDIEDSSRARDFTALNQWLHEPSALQDWGRKTAQEQQRWFYTQWVLKEARLKSESLPAKRSAMQTMRFVPCAADQAQGLTTQIGELAVAVYTASPCSVASADANLAQADWHGWIDPRKTH